MDKPESQNTGLQPDQQLSSQHAALAPGSGRVHQAGTPAVGYPQQQPVPSQQQVHYVPAAQTVYVQTVPPTPHQGYEKFASKQALALGIINLVLGVMIIIANAIGIWKDGRLSKVGHGFWCGAWV